MLLMFVYRCAAKLAPAWSMYCFPYDFRGVAFPQTVPGQGSAGAAKRCPGFTRVAWPELPCSAGMAAAKRGATGCLGRSGVAPAPRRRSAIAY